MAPKDKARGLLDRFGKVRVEMTGEGIDTDMDPQAAKWCALICIAELIKLDDLWLEENGSNEPSEWHKVKDEVEKLLIYDGLQ